MSPAAILKLGQFHSPHFASVHCINEYLHWDSSDGTIRTNSFHAAVAVWLNASIVVVMVFAVLLVTRSEQ